MARAAPPPRLIASTPPPVIGSVPGAIVVFAVLLVFGLLCRHDPTVLFLFKNVAFVVFLVLTPSFAKWIADAVVGAHDKHELNDEKHRFIRAPSELIIFVVAIYGFTFWISGQRLSWLWTGYLALLLLLIEAGAHVVEWCKRRILTRLANARPLVTDSAHLQAMTKREPLLYAAVPFGIVTGATIGVIGHFDGQRTLGLAVKLILLSASIGLIFFLTLSVLRMASPIFVEGPGSQMLTESTNGIANRVIVQVLETRKAKREQREKDLSLMVVISDLRKVYLFNSLHNVILLAVFVALLLESIGIRPGIKWWIISASVLTFLLAQLPYIVGQMLMHDRVLRRFEGTELIDMKAALKKYAPALPKSEFVSALIASNTAGAFLFYLFGELMKQRVH